MSCASEQEGTPGAAEGEEECAICLLSVWQTRRDDHHHRALLCGHRLHSGCLGMWEGAPRERGYARACPCCRRPW